MTFYPQITQIVLRICVICGWRVLAISGGMRMFIVPSLVDALLNPRDRTYSVPQWYDQVVCDISQ